MNLSMALRNNQPVSEFLPKYAEMVEAGLVYSVTYTAAAPAVPSATATGAFALFNPATSGLQLVLLAVTMPAITAPSATPGAALGFQFVANQTPTATGAGNTPANALIGSAGVAKATTFVSGTLVGAPTVAAYWSTGLVANAAGDMTFLKDEIGGAITINPNSGICIVQSGAIAATIAPSLLWAEVPMA